MNNQQSRPLPSLIKNPTSSGGLQELPVNVEHNWIKPSNGETVTVKYTDKRKFEEMIKEYKLLYPAEMEEISSAKNSTVKDAVLFFERLFLATLM